MSGRKKPRIMTAQLTGKGVFRWYALLACFICGCTSTGPVESQIEDSKSMTVSDPPEFQSPVLAFKELTSLLGGSRPTDRHTQFYDPRHAAGVAKLLFDEQAKLEKSFKETGSAFLEPGRSYAFRFQSFCVHAGKERPVDGDGMQLAPIKGAPSKWLPEILSRYQPLGIKQEEAQRLIWALLTNVRFDELSDSDQKNLLKVFPDAEIRFGNRMIESKAKSLFEELLPSEISSLKENISSLRDKFIEARSSYQELEQALAPISSRQHPIPLGWMKTPEGFFVRVTSKDGYRNAYFEVYVPESLSHRISFKPSQFIAIPKEGQRLAISSNPEAIFTEKDLGKIKPYLEKYAGAPLSDEEILLSLKDAQGAYEVLKAKREAEQITQFAFRKTGLRGVHNNEADAYRHFVWSALSGQELGTERARKFLNAHERANPKQPKDQFEMDSFNNEQGLKAASELGPTAAIETIKNAALEALKNNKLVVLEPSGKLPK